MKIPCPGAAAHPFKLFSGMRNRGLRLFFCGAILLCWIGPGMVRAEAAPQGNGAQTTASSAERDHPVRSAIERRAEIRQKRIDNPEADEGENVYRHSPMVQKLAHALGYSVERTSRTFEIINFIVLVIFIVWIVAKILPNALRARTERLQRELQQARAATEEAQRRLAAIEERLSRLDSEIEAVRIQAERETVIEESRLRAALEQEKQSILESAERDIGAAAKNAQSQLKKLAAELVIDQARRQIAVTPETDQALVTGFLTDMKEEHRRGGVN